MRFMTEAKTADYIGIPRLTLKAMRRKGAIDGSFPIPYYRIGVRPMYLVEEVDKFLENARMDAYQKEEPKK